MATKIKRIQTRRSWMDRLTSRSVNIHRTSNPHEIEHYNNINGKNTVCAHESRLIKGQINVPAWFQITRKYQRDK